MSISLSSTDPVVLLIAAMFGAIVGSFINVVAWRLTQQILHPHAQLTLSFPRSHCPACKVQIEPYDLVPILSWVFLRGRCRNCSAFIPVRYPFVEALGACIFAISVFVFGLTLHGAAMALLGMMLLAAATSDVIALLLPDKITLTVFGSGVVLAALSVVPHALFFVTLMFPDTSSVLQSLGCRWDIYGFTSPSHAAIGGILGFSIFFAIHYGYYKWRGVDGLGFGDVKLAGAIGVWTGPWGLLYVILIACWGTIAWWLLFSRRQDARLPFGAALAFGAFAALILLHYMPNLAPTGGPVAGSQHPVCYL